MEKVIFEIEYPKKISEYGMNAIYAGKHWAKRKKDAEYWHYLTHSAMNAAKIPREALFKKPVQITLSWNDRFDIDNHTYMGKMIVDALKGRVIEDDTRKHFAKVVHQFWDKKVIGVEIKEINTKED